VAASVKAKYLTFFLIFNFLTYFGLQWLITHSEYNFLTSVDLAIPLIPGFIWIYHTLVPVIVLSMFFLVIRRDIFMTTFVAFSIATLILSLFYVLFPSFYPRIPIEATTLSEQFLNLTRTIDGAHNTFPSGHVTFAWLLTFCISHATSARKFAWLKPAYALWAVLISVSTLVLKQHYIFDVFSGLALAIICYYCAKNFKLTDNISLPAPSAN